MKRVRSIKIQFFVVIYSKNWCSRAFSFFFFFFVIDDYFQLLPRFFFFWIFYRLHHLKKKAISSVEYDWKPENFSDMYYDSFFSWPPTNYLPRVIILSNLGSWPTVSNKYFGAIIALSAFKNRRFAVLITLPLTEFCRPRIPSAIIFWFGNRYIYIGMIENILSLEVGRTSPFCRLACSVLRGNSKFNA